MRKILLSLNLLILLIISKNVYATDFILSNTTSMFAGEEKTIFTFSIDSEKNKTLVFIVSINSSYPVKKNDFKLRTSVKNTSTSECKESTDGLFICKATLIGGENIVYVITKANPALYESIYRFTLLFLGEKRSVITKKLNLTTNTTQNIITNFTTIRILPKTNLTNVTINLTEFITHEEIDNNEVMVKGIEVDVYPKLTNISATIKIRYTDEEIEGISESSLKIARYNSTSNQWDKLDSIVYVNENYVETNVIGFSIFGIVGKKGTSSLTQVIEAVRGGTSTRLMKKECKLNFDIYVPPIIKGKVNTTIIIPIKISVINNTCQRNLMIKVISPIGTRYLYFTSLKENESRTSNVIFIFEEPGIYSVTVESNGVKKNSTIIITEEKIPTKHNITITYTTTTIKPKYSPSAPTGFIIFQINENVTMILLVIVIIILILLVKKIIKKYRCEHEKNR
jgi:hypothetical protein